MQRSAPGRTIDGRAIELWVLVVVLLLQAVGAIVGGALLVVAPDGSLIEMPVSMLEGSPFADFFVPGLVLLVVLGIGPLVAAYGLLRKLRWGWPLAVLIGPALLVWIGVQVAVVGYSNDPPLQAVYAGVGLVILILALLPGTRRAAGW